MISLVIPAYNEEKIITDTVTKARDFLKEKFSSYELIIVDDGSLDNTFQKAKVAADEHTTVLTYSKNKGKGGAIKHGVMASKGDVVVFTDTDLAYGLNIISDVVKMIENDGFDIVTGSRYLNKEDLKTYPLIRKAASYGFKVVVRAMLKFSATDTQCGIKALKGSVAKKIFSRCVIEGFAFDIEIFTIANMMGLKMGEISAKILTHGESKIHIVKDTIKMLQEIINIKNNISKGLYDRKN